MPDALLLGLLRQAQSSIAETDIAAVVLYVHTNRISSSCPRITFLLLLLLVLRCM